MIDIPNLDPSILIIFGITGDLAKRKLLPALYSLVNEGLLPEPFEIIGITRQHVELDDLLKDVELCINERDNICDPMMVEKLKKNIKLFHMDVTKAEDYDRLLKHLNDIEEHHDKHLNRLYYLSIPPQVFTPIVRLLGEHGHNASCQHGAASTRLLIEKPFGYNLKSAEQLVSEIGQFYGDFQIFRIDHYLAKETVQNILSFRFKNHLFERSWDKSSVKRITLTASETLGIEHRAIFYEQTGALRDIIQSHLFQLLALVTMEEPLSMESKDIHDAKLQALKSIVPIAKDQVSKYTARGQYQGYRDEVDNQDSVIETYAQIKVHINNERWAGVPIIILTGKALDQKLTEIVLDFGNDGGPENQLSLRLQPKEGITLSFQAKKPGFTYDTQAVLMDFNYRHTFESLHPDAYERVLIDALRGDTTLFATSDEVLASWAVIENVVQEWAKDDIQLTVYPKGSTGPNESSHR